LGEDNSWADLEDQSEELDLGNLTVRRLEQETSKKGKKEGKKEEEDAAKKKEEKKDDGSDDKKEKKNEEEEKEDEESDKDGTETKDETDDDNSKEAESEKKKDNKKADRRMHAEALGVPKSFHKMKKSYDIMDDQYLTAAYQGETLGSRTLPSTTLNAKSRKLTTITPKVNPSSTTTESKHLNLICKEEADLAEINAEHAFRRLWEDNSWMYDFGTHSPSEKKRAKEMFRRNSNLFSPKTRRLSSKTPSPAPLTPYHHPSPAHLPKHHGKIFLIDEPEHPDQAKTDVQPSEIAYKRALETLNTSNKAHKRPFKKLLSDSEGYLSEKFELKEADSDPRAMFEVKGSLNVRRGLKNDDADTDHDKEKKDKEKEEERECEKQRDNGDESDACKEKGKEEKEEEGDKEEGDDSDPDEDGGEKRGLEGGDDGGSEDVEDEEDDESEAGNGGDGELSDEKDTGGGDGGDRRGLEEQSEEIEDGDDEEEEADKKEEKSTETKDSKDEKKDKDKKAKAKDDDKTPKKKSEDKKAARRLSVEKNLVDTFELTGRVDGLAAKKEVNFVKRGRRDRVLLTAHKKFDHNKPILSVSYDELKRLQQMEHTLTLKTRKLLKTLTSLPAGGISLQTKIIKIYAAAPTPASPQTPLEHGDSRSIRFEFLDQKEFTFTRETFRKSGFRKIRLKEAPLS
jgi:hypothetical protein